MYEAYPFVVTISLCAAAFLLVFFCPDFVSLCLCGTPVRSLILAAHYPLTRGSLSAR